MINYGVIRDAWSSQRAEGVSDSSSPVKHRFRQRRS